MSQIQLLGQHTDGTSMLSKAIQNPSGDIDMQNLYKVKNAINPTQNQDYVTLAYGNANYASGSGTPSFIQSTDLSVKLEAQNAGLVYTGGVTDHFDMNSHLIRELSDPLISTDASNKNYTDTQDNLRYLATTTLNNITLANGTINANTHFISNVVDPVFAQDVATKNYVDNMVSTPSDQIISPNTITSLTMVDNIGAVLAGNVGDTFDMGFHRIENVDDGLGAFDAVNLGQLDNAITNVDRIQNTSITNSLIINPSSSNELQLTLNSVSDILVISENSGVPIFNSQSGFEFDDNGTGAGFFKQQHTSTATPINLVSFYQDNDPTAPLSATVMQFGTSGTSNNQAVIVAGQSQNADGYPSSQHVNLTAILGGNINDMTIVGSSASIATANYLKLYQTTPPTLPNLFCQFNCKTGYQGNINAITDITEPNQFTTLAFVQNAIGTAVGTTIESPDLHNILSENNGQGLGSGQIGSFEDGATTGTVQLYNLYREASGVENNLKMDVANCTKYEIEDNTNILQELNLFCGSKSDSQCTFMRMYDKGEANGGIQIAFSAFKGVGYQNSVSAPALSNTNQFTTYGNVQSLISASIPTQIRSADTFYGITANNINTGLLFNVENSAGSGTVQRLKINSQSGSDTLLKMDFNGCTQVNMFGTTTLTQFALTPGTLGGASFKLLNDSTVDPSGGQFMFNRKSAYSPAITVFTDDQQLVNRYYVVNGYYANTVPLQSITLASADVSINSHKLTNVTDGTATQDALTYNQLYNLYSRGMNRIQKICSPSLAQLTLAGWTTSSTLTDQADGTQVRITGGSIGGLTQDQMYYQDVESTSTNFVTFASDNAILHIPNSIYSYLNQSYVKNAIYSIPSTIDSHFKISWKIFMTGSFYAQTTGTTAKFGELQLELQADTASITTYDSTKIIGTQTVDFTSFLNGILGEVNSGITFSFACQTDYFSISSGGTSVCYLAMWMTKVQSNSVAGTNTLVKSNHYMRCYPIIQLVNSTD